MNNVKQVAAASTIANIRSLAYKYEHGLMTMREVCEGLSPRKPVKAELPFNLYLDGVINVFELISYVN